MRFSTCHPDRKYHAKGLCKKCYDRNYAASEKALAATRAYKASDLGQATIEAYNKSEKGKATREAYARSEKRRAALRKYRNSAKGQANAKAYHSSEEFRAKNNARCIERRASDPVFLLKCRLRTRISNVLKRKSKKGSAIKDLGCTGEHLKQYIESKFLEGMTWENRNLWHIDHIKPLASFDLEDPEQFKQACHYTNLQPLWAKDNISKGKKII
jgi:hypothetical protein